MSIIPKRTVSQLSRVHQGLMMALCRLSLFHRSGNAASATPYFGHRVQRAPKANSSTAAGSARPASGHCLQRLPHQAINTYNNAYVKPIRFGSSSCSSPPGNFFAFCCASWHLLRHLQAVFSLSSVSFLRMRMLGDLELLWIATAKLWQCHLDLPALAELLLCSCGP